MKSKRRILVDKLDKQFSLLVRAISKREFAVCPFCHIRQIECCFHFVTRAKHSVRWDLTNAVGSCHSCNYTMEYNPHPFVSWYIKRNGLDAYENLILRSNKIAKFGIGDLEDILQGIYDGLEHFNKGII